MFILDSEKLYGTLLVFEDIRLVRLRGRNVDGCGYIQKMETVKTSTSTL